MESVKKQSKDGLVRMETFETSGAGVVTAAYGGNVFRVRCSDKSARVLFNILDRSIYEFREKKDA